MQLYITLPLTFAVVALTVLYWRLTRDTSLQAVRRKERLRVYFVRALDLNGEVADSLWFHDCWLTQGDESYQQMKDFAAQLCKVCELDFGMIFRPTDAGYICSVADGTINIWCYSHSDSLHIMLEDSWLNTRIFMWTRPSSFRESQSRSWMTGHLPTHVYDNFQEWREQLLQALAEFAVKK